MHIHHKVYLPTYGLFDEGRFFAWGNETRAFDTCFGRLGLLICEDFWHSSLPYLLWLDGADVMLFCSASPGRGTVFDDTEKFQTDPHWRDLLLFYEYFHGDNGAGIGASHQTGWTGIAARLMHLFATTTAEQALALGKMAAVTEVAKPAGTAKPRRPAKRRGG